MIDYGYEPFTKPVGAIRAIRLALLTRLAMPIAWRVLRGWRRLRGSL
jgi:hypothetical protein